MSETVHSEKTMPDLSRSKTDRYHALLTICVLIFVSALLFRLMKLILDPGLMRDSTLYLQWAENWRETGDYYFTVLGNQVKTAVLPVWLIKTFMGLGFGSEITGRTLSIFLGSLIPVFGFLAALRACGRIRIALLSALLLIFHPDLVAYSVQALRDNYYLFFESVLLLTIVDGCRNDSVLKWSACGVLVSLLSFCRYEGLEFLAIVPLVIFMFSVFRKGRRKRVIVNVAAFSFLFGITSLFLLSLSDFDSGVVAKLQDIMRISYSNQD